MVAPGGPVELHAVLSDSGGLARRSVGAPDDGSGFASIATRLPRNLQQG